MKRILVNSRLFKILIITLIILIVLILISSLFIKLYIPFGGTPSSSDRENYKKRASNYKDGKFYNENDFIKYLSITCSLPEWMVEHFIKEYGKDKAETDYRFSDQ